MGDGLGAEPDLRHHHPDESLNRKFEWKDGDKHSKPRDPAFGYRPRATAESVAPIETEPGNPMTQRCILFLDFEGVAAWFWRRGWLRRGPCFAPDDEGLQSFATWLGSQAGTHFTLVADCVEEGFQFENVPFVTGRDRTALLSRKLTQLFYGSPYSAGMSCGRERSGRRDEQILFVALTRPSQLEPWMERLRAADVVIVGITTTALLVGAALRNPARQSSRTLIVCRTAAGIRQTLLEEGRLRFSRLATLPGNDTDWSNSVMFEIQKTYQYLVAQRAIARNSRLAVSVLADTSEHPALREACSSSDLIEVSLLDLADRIRSVGLRAANCGSDATQLLIHLAARGKSAAQLAPAQDRQSYRWWLAQRATLAIGAIGLVAALLISLETEINTRSLDQAKEDIRLDSQARHLRYERLLATMPKLPAAIDSIQGVVREIDQIAALDTGPTQALSHISRVMDRHPEVDIQRIEWSLPDLTLANLGKNATQEAPNPQESAATIIILDARLNSGTPLSQRETVEVVHRILEDMRREGAQEASVIRLPFEYGSDRTLRSAAESTNDGVSLRISFPIEKRT